VFPDLCVELLAPVAELGVHVPHLAQPRAEQRVALLQDNDTKNMIRESSMMMNVDDIVVEDDCVRDGDDDDDDAGDDVISLPASVSPSSVTPSSSPG
jgi:hypothetical protein